MVVRTVNPFAHYITRLYSGYTPCLLVTPHLVIRELANCRQNHGPPWDPMSWIRWIHRCFCSRLKMWMVPVACFPISKINPHLATMGDAWQEWRGVDCQYAGLLKPPFPDSSKRFLPGFARKVEDFTRKDGGSKR